MTHIPIIILRYIYSGASFEMKTRSSLSVPEARSVQHSCKISVQRCFITKKTT